MAGRRKVKRGQARISSSSSLAPFYSRELREARAQQAATAAILRVINRSRGNPQPVFEAIVGHAARLCNARDASVFRVEGAAMRRIASRGRTPTVLKLGNTRPISRASISGRAILERRPVHVPDLRSVVNTRFPELKSVRQWVRTVIGVPLLLGGKAVGAITVYRDEVRPFTSRQIVLLETFASQAVIAIENARLFKELEASDQRYDIAMHAVNEGVYDWNIADDTIFYSDRVYEAVGMSAEDYTTPKGWRDRLHPEDLPKYDAALVAHFKGKTKRFECDVRYRGNDGKWHWARQHGIAVRDAKGRAIRLIGSTGNIDELKRTEEALRSSEERYQLATQAATEGIYDWNVETGVLYVSEQARKYWGFPRGALTNNNWSERVHPDDFPGYRQAVIDHFKGRTRALEHEMRVRNAKDEYRWVVDRGIAVRNAKGRAIRLVGAENDITERKLAEIAAREALERQTATADILRVISNSPADVTPVLAAVCEHAARICEARVVDVILAEGAHMRVAATFGALGRPLGEAVPLDRATVMGRSIVDRRPVQVADLQAEKTDFARGREMALKYGHRTILGVPLMREDRALGTILVRRAEVRPFDEKHIGLLKTFADQAAIAIENVRLFNETKNSLARQTATADILRVLGGSMTDTQPVFDAIVRNCHALFKDSGVMLRIAADGQLHVKASVGYPVVGAIPIDRSSAIGTSVVDARTIHFPDLEEAAKKYPRIRQLGLKYGYRSGIYAPLMHRGKAIGAMSVLRREFGAFDDQDVQLFNTFADQAVIAIENARLFNETKEALERQTATAEILKVIASSPADVQPVLDAVADRAVRLTGGASAALYLLEGETLQRAAVSGPFVWQVPGLSQPLSSLSTGGFTVREKRAIHVHDISEERGTYPHTWDWVVRYAREIGLSEHHTMVTAPLLKDDAAIGYIMVRRAEVRPFSDKEIALLRTFADQAVIAIENVRLFNETKEALEQQKASGEVLGAISSSIADTQPVFDRILSSCERLFAGRIVGINVVHADGLLRIGAYHGEGRDRFERIFPLPVGPGSGSGLAIAERRVVHYPDAQADEVPAPTREGCAALGVRSVIFAPMLREGRGLGAIFVGRDHLSPFSEKEIALLRTFADQAAIAIENVRLFNETKESLERQTATAEILKVIASSPADVQPVFEAIVSTAVRLCGASFGRVYRYDGARIEMVAGHGLSKTGLKQVRQVYPRAASDDTIVGQIMRSREPFFVRDIKTDPHVPPLSRQMIEALDTRSQVTVPMLRGETPIGAISMGWAQPDGFTEPQVALLKTFADQAAIAVENVRLFNETKEALERQTATAEILQVISSTPTDTQPVFDAITTRAMKLCGTELGGLFLVSDGMLNYAHTPFAADAEEHLKKHYPRAVDTTSLVGRSIVERQVVHVPDLRDPSSPRSLGTSHLRSQLSVPLMREGTAIGSLTVARRTPGRFTDAQIALLKSFADQAVIAIENVRLFKELQQRIGQMTSLREVGQAIGSTLDLQTVLKTIVQHAVKLTGLDAGAIYEYDEAREQFNLRASEGILDDVAENLRLHPIRKGEGAVGGTAVTREPVQVADVQVEGYDTRLREILLRSGRRAVLAVPLLHENRIVGAINVQKSAPGPFAPEVVELLRTFATQSAMAIQNARLFREIAEKGKQLEVASQHKSQFLASMSHELRTPLNAILGFNEMVLDEVYGALPEDVKPPLQNMQTSGRHLLRLINNVLDLAKIEAGRMELSLSDYSVHDTVESVRSTLTPLAAEKGLEFLAKLPADLPLAYGDGGRITQCLMNLAGNSLKFTKQGKVEIAVVQENGLLRYSVADTGIGIPPDKISSLFTEFKQTDATIASEYGGTGLGLSITKKFIEMHGGKIWVESEPGKGSTFLFEIPLRVGT